MIKKTISSFIVLLFACSIDAQTSYPDSMAAYQLHYKQELFSVIKNDTAAVKFYPVDPSYQVIADVEKLSGEKYFNMPTSSGMTKQAIRYLKLKFNLHGKDYTIYAYRLSMLMSTEKYKDDFFIPFIDGTSGIESYGGGRYIDFVTSNITSDNKLVIDFNRSYNPYCAFRSGYNCPIPPKENELLVEIRAGEMGFSKH